MADNTLSINTGTINAPYQEFTYTIPAGSNIKVNYVTENFALLEVSAPEVLHVNFGGSANETPFLAGMRYKLPEIVPNVTLFNRSDTPLTVHFAVGCGEIDDNRLTVVGSINTVSTYSHFETSTAAQNDANFGTISGAWEKIVIQNNGVNDILIGDDSKSTENKAGLLVKPGGNVELPTTATVHVMTDTTSGIDISVAAFSSLQTSVDIQLMNVNLTPGG